MNNIAKSGTALAPDIVSTSTSPLLHPKNPGLIKRIKHGLVDFFHSISRPYIFMGYQKKINATAFLKKLNTTSPHEKIPELLTQKIKLGMDYKKANFFSARRIQNKMVKIKETIEKLDMMACYEARISRQRQALEAIGGEQVSIMTADNVALNGMYLDAQKLRLKIGALNGSLVNYKHNGDYRALVFPDKRNDDPDFALRFNSLLSSLNNLDEFRLVEDKKNGNVLIVNNDRYNTLKDQIYYNIPNTRAPINNCNQAFGTVILTSGALGTYEGHGDEAVYFLSQNMNVLLFNFRGYGKSEGIPSKKGLKQDMEAAYQFAKTKSKHSDEKLLFKGLCLGGGPAAYVASKHPKVNLFLDKSFSSFRQVAKENSSDYFKLHLRKILNGTANTPIKNKAIEAIAYFVNLLIKPFFDCLVFDFPVEKYLTKIDGQIGMFYSYWDEVISCDHAKKNMEAVYKREELRGIRSNGNLNFCGSGSHFDKWLNRQTEAEMNTFLKNSRLAVNKEYLTAKEYLKA